MEKKTSSGKSAPATNSPSGKKSSGKSVFVLIMVLLVVGLLAGAAGCYLYDYFGVRTSVVGFFVGQDDQYITRMAQLDQREAELNVREATLTDMAAQQEQTQQKQQREQEQLDAQKAELEKENNDLNDRITAFDNAETEFGNVVQTVAAMDAQSAATMLETLASVEDAARILNAMPSKQAAAILEKMTANGAKKVAETLIRLSQ